MSDYDPPPNSTAHFWGRVDLGGRNGTGYQPKCRPHITIPVPVPVRLLYTLLAYTQRDRQTYDRQTELSEQTAYAIPLAA